MNSVEDLVKRRTFKGRSSAGVLGKVKYGRRTVRCLEERKRKEISKTVFILVAELIFVFINLKLQFLQQVTTS